MSAFLIVGVAIICLVLREMPAFLISFLCYMRARLQDKARLSAQFEKRTGQENNRVSNSCITVELAPREQVKKTTKLEFDIKRSN